MQTFLGTSHLPLTTAWRTKSVMKHSRVSRLVVWLVSAGALVFLGCGAGRGVITGEVTYKGEPVSVGRITFLSQVDKQEVKSADIIRGKYTMKEFPAGP